jgi:hypothetical protein
MKKILGIVVLGLLLSGNVYADIYSNCYFDRVSDPKFKSFERKSFKDMTGFSNHGVFIVDKSYRITGIPLPSEDFEKIADLEFDTGKRSVYDYPKLKWSYIKDDGSIIVKTYKYKRKDWTENYIEYTYYDQGSGILVLNKSNKEIQVKGYHQKFNPNWEIDLNTLKPKGRWEYIKDNKDLTLFLKCEKYKKVLTFTEAHQKKKKAFKIENYNSLAVIIIGLLNLIVLSLLLWRTFRKK